MKSWNQFSKRLICSYKNKNLSNIRNDIHKPISRKVFDIDLIFEIIAKYIFCDKEAAKVFLFGFGSQRNYFKQLLEIRASSFLKQINIHYICKRNPYDYIFQINQLSEKDKDNYCPYEKLFRVEKSIKKAIERMKPRRIYDVRKNELKIFFKSKNQKLRYDSKFADAYCQGQVLSTPEEIYGISIICNIMHKHFGKQFYNEHKRKYIRMFKDLYFSQGIDLDKSVDDTLKELAKIYSQNKST